MRSSSGTTQNPFLWRGRQGALYGEESDFYSIGHLQYLADQGRFAQQAGPPETLNLYAVNDPVDDAGDPPGNAQRSYDSHGRHGSHGSHGSMGPPYNRPRPRPTRPIYHGGVGGHGSHGTYGSNIHGPHAEWGHGGVGGHGHLPQEELERRRQEEEAREEARITRCLDALELAKLADAVYVDEVPEGWEVIRTTTHPSGYRSRLYRNKTTNEYVLAFAGTDDLIDWIANVLQGGGYPSLQYQQALNEAEIVIRRYIPDGCRLRITGHSLGGGMGTAVALCHGLEAITYNPAGVHENTIIAGCGSLDCLNKADELITAYVTSADILTRLQALPGDFPPNTVGTVITLYPRTVAEMAAEHVFLLSWIVFGPLAGAAAVAYMIDQHYMVHILERLEYQCGECE